ncbi:nucleotidyltransferase [Fervidicella metallireducens AeB]|uniref:Nucleotidyltransferase n=1 Tax=Fervidicella metallireducens AeB TaxID=1403537 RepID=A0A017RXE8_9CLOT|nr:sugar phosphate nucleotidyltransferase [Fervidicella metallireducens]EYE89372.1 nucleotidyltransferase [Fervidicella metallireducens AeB]
MKAVIMAGGEGTRLRPLTSDIPKPMVPILNKPVMEHIINLLKKHNIVDIAATLYYLPSSIKDYFDDGRELGVNISYYVEEVPLGTGGSVLNAENFLDDTFIVISGDALTDINITEALKFHKEKGSKATLILKKENIPLEYGIVITDENGKIIRFLEKPSWGEVFSDTVNTGIYILEPDVLNYYKKGQNFDFSKDLFPKLLKDSVPMFGYITEDYWCDIGDINSYKQTQFDVLDGKVRLEIAGTEISKGIWVEDGCIVSEDVKITPPVYIGKDCIINSNSTIDSYCIIGNNTTIDSKSTLKRSVIWCNTYIGKNSQLRGTILCNKVKIKNNVNIFEDTVIGAECTLQDGCTIKPNIKIWPNKTIKEDTIINKNLVWGTKARRTLFGNRDISGDVNIDITPEFASLLGSAFASAINKDSPVIISCDSTPASKIIKQSLIAGVLSTGARAIDIENIILPINRFAVRFYRGSGGVHISTFNCDPNKVHIEFTNNMGGNIQRSVEKKIENLFLREDFQRCNSDMINEVINVDNFTSLYIQTSANSIKSLSKIRSKNYNILVSSENEKTTMLTLTFLNFLGCKADGDYSIKNFNSMEKFIDAMGKKIKRGNYNFGVVLSENGENLTLIDENGIPVRGEKYTVLASLIALKSGTNKKLVVPYTTTRVIENIAMQYKAEVIRTKSSPSEIMNTMLNLAEDEDSLIQYILSYDGILAVGKILEYLTLNSISLGDLLKEIPEFYVKHDEVLCDFKDRGRVIRRLIEEHSNRDIELFEGIKINTQKGWTLILPDNERPIFNIFSEGFNEEYAEELCLSISDKICKIVNND